MNIPSYDPVNFFYGTTGEETAKKMDNSLKNHSLSLSFDKNTQKFTISGSSEIDKETIEKIFKENHYQIWKPLVLDERDKFGNRLVELNALLTPEFPEMEDSESVEVRQTICIMEHTEKKQPKKWTICTIF